MSTVLCIKVICWDNLTLVGTQKRNACQAQRSGAVVGLACYLLLQSQEMNTYQAACAERCPILSCVQSGAGMIHWGYWEHHVPKNNCISNSPSIRLTLSI